MFCLRIDVFEACDFFLKLLNHEEIKYAADGDYSDPKKLKISCILP